jgi:hypothetical protein
MPLIAGFYSDERLADSLVLGVHPRAADVAGIIEKMDVISAIFDRAIRQDYTRRLNHSAGILRKVVKTLTQIASEV